MNKKLMGAILANAHDKQFLYDGNFTICLLSDDDGKIVSFGVAKRNPNCDEYNLLLGEDISFRRAVKKLLKFAKKPIKKTLRPRQKKENKK